MYTYIRRNSLVIRPRNNRQPDARGACEDEAVEGANAGVVANQLRLTTHTTLKKLAAEIQKG